MRRYNHGRLSAGVIGAGYYGTGIVSRATFMPDLDVVIVADVDIEAAIQSFCRAGHERETVVICGSSPEVQKNIGRGNPVVVEDASLLLGSSVDVVVESSGDAVAGAAHAHEAILNGKHIVMVTKETDVTVGPYLHFLAGKNNVRYRQAAGDQHGLLIELVSWARDLGFSIVCAGKSRDSDLVLDDAAGVVSQNGVIRARGGLDCFAVIGPSSAAAQVGGRAELLGPWVKPGGWDQVELAVAANCLGLGIDKPETHCPPVRTSEISRVMCTRADGGLLSKDNTVDMVTVIRHPDEMPWRGGVFIVVKCQDECSASILKANGLVTGDNGCALLYRPFHLLGVETGSSILDTTRMPQDYCADVRPRYDVCARARMDLKQGYNLRDDHNEDLEFLILPSRTLTDDGPVPFHLAANLPLKHHVSTGSMILLSMVDAAKKGELLRLRMLQDEHFRACRS
ncbi:hypothetical protein ACFLSJ_08760 [Verrucomicrobiota bacterium]